MRQAVLNLGKGDLQHGFPGAIVQLWHSEQSTPLQVLGGLPAAPELAGLYQRWRRLYDLLYSGLGLRRTAEFDVEFEIDNADVTHGSRAEFDDLCRELQHRLNGWLCADAFRKIDQTLRTHLAPNDDVRVLIAAESEDVLRLPWSLWQFFEDYPNAELAVSPPEYAPALKVDRAASGTIRILAVLGDRTGIDLDADRAALSQLPHAKITFLVEPSRAELDQQLWKPGWDLLFFAGHSTSQGAGQIQINPREGLTIEQLKYGLRTAIAHGLKLAIFNSCDGLKLAQGLADLHLPQMIVMREPVPDHVAQAFLKQFLAAFASGRSLYAAVRQAREQLQPLEDQFPCATWLPVICQNPADVPTDWRSWSGRGAMQPPTRRDWKILGVSSLLITGLVVAVRAIGLLQPLELATFDRLMRLRPAELPDTRMVVITVTEDDIRAQGPDLRRGSLSDRSLAQLLAILEPTQPRAIGLDLYRDFAATPALAEQLRRTRNLIGICKRPDPQDDPTGTLPPPELPEARLGFSDFVQDFDGVVRRHLLFMSPNPTSTCTPAYAFSVQLAFRYLVHQGITPAFTPAGDLQLGNAVFPGIASRTGGYAAINASGSQVLLNYRATSSPMDIAPRVTLRQVLTGQVNPNAFRDRIVLIGAVTPTSGDYWSTPYGKAFSTKLPGVLVQAHMVSQMLSTVLDRRPLLWVASPWGEALWLLGWSLLGGILSWRFRRLLYWGLAVSVTAIAAFWLCVLLLSQAGWLPFVPALIALLLNSSIVAYLLTSKVTR
ncbi:CHASE2 domain-containing protein [Leptolyngbya sp. FACHB-36]|uniref:CHASE2 domain-containing protein n=1 Tax=Leptolyngbya sp. FACHB-36 TaxID=2692808 RepID=UPI0016809C94|nr:CHASE2 domain-containing protein [Leptolyngbya sp. FACHB-36]MBD2020864.1 CHASE2 domain-containing protein [Leptolyngbya sp. FACHB-36]